VNESSTSSKLSLFYRSKPVTFILRSSVLAFILGTLAYLILPFQPEKYVFTLVDSSSFVPDPEGYRQYYMDLNSDGKTDFYNFGNFGENSSLLMAQTSEGVVIDQWNFRGRFSESLYRQLVSDYDHDGRIEISAISLDKNQIYLSIIEPFEKDPVVVLNMEVDTIWKKFGEQSLFFDAGESVDLNHDGFDEIIFSFSSGNARQPRKVYAYDIQADSVWSSPYSGSFLSEVKAIDIDLDGKTELVGRCTAPYNYIDESINLPDSFSWLIILDEKLQYRVPPKPLGPSFSSSTLITLPEGDSLANFVYVGSIRDSSNGFNWYRVLSDFSIKSEKFQFNPSATRTYQFIYPTYGNGGLFYNNTDAVLFINSKSEVFSDPKFPKRVSALTVLNPTDGVNEFQYCLLIDGKRLKLSFFSEKGTKLGTIDGVDYAGLVSISWTGKVNEKHRLFLAGKDLFQWYEVDKNPWQYLQYLIWLGFVMGFYGFIELIRFSQANEISKREDLRKELLELQLKAMKNQLDPHFTFNALNGLSYLAMSGDTARVANFINHFSRLLRTHLYTSDKALVKLSYEIQFLENYMELQSMRFDDLINLELIVDSDVDMNLLVPKMILQTHVENAVKHGLRPMLLKPREAPALVKVSVFNKGDSIIILIEDNGVGRGHGKVPTEESTGTGLQVLEKIYASVKQLYKLVITQSFEDLMNKDGQPIGTRVRIKIDQR
jgi:hypothetical protein